MGTQCGGVKGAFAGGTVYDWSRSDNNNGVSIYFYPKILTLCLSLILIKH